MEVKEAVTAAKNCVMDLFAEEGITNVGLEEIDLDHGDTWRVTIGFSRPWNTTVGAMLVGGADRFGGVDRSYKIIWINDEDGRIISVKDHKLRN